MAKRKKPPSAAAGLPAVVPPRRKTFSGVLGAIADSGLAKFIGLVVAVVVGISTAVYLFADHAPKTVANGNVGVCKLLDADLLKTIASGAGSGLEWLKPQLVTNAERVSQATSGSALENALIAQRNSLDAVKAWASDPHLSGSGELDVISEVVAASDGVARSCAKLGVAFHDYNPISKAEGSISTADALSYCSSVQAFLKEAASGSSDPQHLGDLNKLMLDRATNGLPAPIYAATTEFTAMIANAVVDKSYPPAEQAMTTIRAYCVGVGSTGWPR